ncbi:threonine--tRNA ligase [Patescibacteria group bacterium]|nr:threonine--tRNA ligase [Patescibacteria group bacterium]MBU4353300.1 threonine--tRNA ligase [Patescibacteria group bacterium]MBU4477355.1 threonine--tRNA ligase [Patescibacteria group bacterium]MCG2699245.1 threonine--tRNA ligase [Candidatus Parcubacteria bacterium]
MEKSEKIRHSLAHLLAMAVLEKFPGAKLGIGPTIENGFYYDFGGISLSAENLPDLEKRMRELIKDNIKFTREEISEKEAKEIFSNQQFKLELIEELKNNNQQIIIYKSGNFIDLCAGPHIEQSKEINPDSFKLTKIAGAYWRGDEKNPMLARVYGVAFDTKKELENYLKFLEEAEKRDHRKIGKELDLFSFHEEGPGFPFWHQKGMALYNQLKKFIREENKKRGYGEAATPILLKKDLWVLSGHWEKFKDDMYFSEIDKQEFAVKPMNCPGGLLIYNEKIHSYRDLPIRLAEFGFVHRHELSGVLHGLFRVRAFTQDDAHSFCAPEQLNNEIIQMIEYALNTYKAFGFNDYEIFIATRPEKYIGDDEVWEKATSALMNSLKEKGLDYKIKEGEGAFYGPKIEFNIKDAVARNWQLGTIQVDFSMPKRFSAFYVDKNGDKQTPIMIHRAILGSLERFIGILIEHYAGALPVWLSPIQAQIIPVSEKFNKYGEKILEELKNADIRAEIDTSNETLGKRIRNAELQKNPYILVVGEKEKDSGAVSVRSRIGDEGVMELKNFLEKIQKEISSKKN